MLCLANWLSRYFWRDLSRICVTPCPPNYTRRDKIPATARVSVHTRRDRTRPETQPWDGTRQSKITAIQDIVWAESLVKAHCWPAPHSHL